MKFSPQLLVDKYCLKRWQNGFSILQNVVCDYHIWAPSNNVSDNKGQCFLTFSKSGNLSKISYHFVEPQATYSTTYSIFREPSKELAGPLGSAEPKLKNTDLGGDKVWTFFCNIHSWARLSILSHYFLSNSIHFTFQRNSSLKRQHSIVVIKNFT